ncbi:putative translation initiation factor IF-2 [Lactobacillus iners ATCC 55195]|nr:putative translation initiation factor IF-2 [Lactobacillus iners ATCC 55195]
MKESDLMTRIRLYELAKELGIENKVIVEKARELGFDVKSHMSSLTDDQINKIRELYKNKSDKKRQNKSKIKVSVGALRRTNSNEDNNKKKKRLIQPKIQTLRKKKQIIQNQQHVIY